MKKLTKFQSEQVDPLLDALYEEGETFVQRHFALEKHAQSRGLATKLAQQPAEITPEEQAINRQLTESVVLFGMNSAAAVLCPPLMWLSVPLLLKQALSTAGQAYLDVKEERKIGVNAMIAVGQTSLLFLRNFWIFSLFDALYMCSTKVLHMTRDSSQHNLANAFGEMPRVAWCQRDDMEVEVPIEQIRSGDVIIIHAGEMVPVDGKIVSGFATIDEHMLTGEAQPAEKSVEDTVYAGTMAVSGEVMIRVEKAGVETVTGQISEILKQTADYRSTIELRGEKIANASVLPTLALGAATWGLLGPVSATALLSCFVGFQLRYTSPLSILNFLQIAAKEGILVKDGRALELISQVDTIVFDKTGTLTLEQLTVGKIHACGAVAARGNAETDCSEAIWTEADVLRYAAAAEYKQTHPIARAILQEAQSRQVEIPVIAEATYTTGFGLEVTVQEKNALAQQVYVGSARFMEQQQIPISEAVQSIERASHQQGHSLIYVAIGKELAGVIELQPTIRPEATEVVAALKARQMELYIISGDQAAPTQNLAEKLGIDHYFAQVLPEHKAKLVAELQQAGKSVCFIGDGINDSIALKKADVSISLRGATTMAMDTAQMILMDGTLQQLPNLFAISDKLETNMKRNFLAGTLPGLICLGGVFFLNFGIFTACLLSWTGLSAGIANAMQPLLRYQQSPSEFLLDSDE
ncbi:MAG: heavy metal translocating P-type ATPase [Chloroflexota bacterium]